MKSMRVENLRIFFEDGQRGPILLADLGDFKSNASRALWHYIDENRSVVWVMRDNLQNVIHYIEGEDIPGSSLQALAAVLMIREFFQKYRQRRILQMFSGKRENRVMISMSKLLPIFHDENLLYAVSPEIEAPFPDHVIPIRAECGNLPLPTGFYDVIFCEGGQRMDEIYLALRPGGLCLMALSPKEKLSSGIPGMEVFSDREGNRLLSLRWTEEFYNILKEKSFQGEILRRKKLLSYLYSEIGANMESLFFSKEDSLMDAMIARVSLAEDTILPIYEEMRSDDIKYLMNRLKESLIEFRLHKEEEMEKEIMEHYLALGREIGKDGAW